MGEHYGQRATAGLIVTECTAVSEQGKGVINGPGLWTEDQKLRKLAAVCIYGATRTISFLLGDPPKRVVKRLARSMPGHRVRCDYLAHYDMDHSTPEHRVAFLQKVRRTFETCEN
jgi:NADH:flavin oxidoreductase / NADH oxidase family